MGVPTPPIRKDLATSDATFVRPDDLTARCRLDDVGLGVIGQVWMAAGCAGRAFSTGISSVVAGSAASHTSAPGLSQCPTTLSTSILRDSALIRRTTDGPNLPRNWCV